MLTHRQSPPPVSSDDLRIARMEQAKRTRTARTLAA